jgi:hypothetical protein
MVVRGELDLAKMQVNVIFFIPVLQAIPETETPG